MILCPSKYEYEVLMKYFVGLYRKLSSSLLCNIIELHLEN